MKRFDSSAFLQLVKNWSRDIWLGSLGPAMRRGPFEAAGLQDNVAIDDLRSGIIYGLIAERTIMEAERINSLAALLADLTTREADLRGYL